MKINFGVLNSFEFSRGFAAAVTAMAAFLIISKAAILGMTFDEAYTLFNYCQSNLGFLNIDIANNHPLNSLAVRLSTSYLGSSEFAVRAPCVLAGLFYLASVLFLVKRMRRDPMPLAAISLFVLCPYLIDFFSLSRGYAISTALVQWGLTAFFLIPDLGLGYLILVLCVFVASLSVFSVILMGYCAIATWIVFLGLHKRGWKCFFIPQSNKFTVGWTFLLFFLGVIPILLLRKVSHPGKPLAHNEGGFLSALLQPLLGMHFDVGNRYWASGLMVALVGALFLANWRYRTLSTRSAYLISVFSALLVSFFILAKFLCKPYPPSRTLIPFLPLLSFTVLSLAMDFPYRKTVSYALVNVGLCMLLLFCFTRRIDIHHSYEWPGYEGIREDMTRRGPQCADRARPGVEPIVQYYRMRYFNVLAEPGFGLCP